MPAQKHIETCFNYVDKNIGFFSSDEKKWINKMHRLKEQYPDQVTILREPDDNDDCIYVRLPSYWLKVQPKKVQTKIYTEEEKQLIRERLAAAKKKSST